MSGIKNLCWNKLIIGPLSAEHQISRPIGQTCKELGKALPFVKEK
jgi:hypothetical protein